MGLLNNVIKRNEQVAATGEDKKLLININSRIEDLKLQNMENARFLRGLSRKIESELEQIKEVEANRSIEVHDESKVISSIERVEKALEEINNNDVMEEIDRINKTLEDSVTKINTSVSKIDTDQMAGIIENFGEIQEGLGEIQEAVDNITKLVEEKLNVMVSHTNSLKTVVEKQTVEVKDELEEMIVDIERGRDRRISGLKGMVGFNLWLTFLNAALFVAYILGVFN